MIFLSLILSFIRCLDLGKKMLYKKIFILLHIKIVYKKDSDPDLEKNGPDPQHCIYIYRYNS